MPSIWRSLRLVGLVGGLILALVLMVEPASASVRNGAASDGTRFHLDGKRIAVKLPKGIVRGSRVHVSCGREGKAGRQVTSARRRYSGRRHMRLRFRTDVSRRAEWCFYTFKSKVGARRLPYSAARLLPRRSPAPAALRSGPGVREAVTSDGDGAAFGGLEGETGDARFLLKANVLTVRLRAGFSRSRLVRLACTRGHSPGDAQILGYRALVLPAHRRVITADLEADAGTDAAVCVIEGTGGNSRDIAAAQFP